MIPKQNGWNSVSGSYAYDVEYFFSYDYREVVQNKLDQVNKYTKNKQQVIDYFSKNHVNKIYNYQYTGKNDQILDFNISMNNKLTKLYVQPSDAFMYEAFVKQGSGARIAIDDSNIQIINDIEKEYNQAVEIQTGIQGQVDQVSDEIMSLTDDMTAQWASSQGMSMKEAGDVLATRTGDEKLQLFAQGEEAVFTPERKERLTELHNTLDRIQAEDTSARQRERQLLAEVDQVYQDVIATQLSGNTPLDVADRNLATAGVVRRATSSNPILLVEDIDNDVISKLETSTFNSILATQLNNPVVFNRITKAYADPRKLSVIKSTDIENVEIAREKYYESRIGMSSSMINADMTIKGDPYWIEGYIGKPAKIKEHFGEQGTDIELQILTSLNGINGCIVRSDVTEGTDEFGNPILSQFISSLYTVNNITSQFSSGQFTQNLELSKFTAAEQFDDMNYLIGGEIEEPAKVQTNYTTAFGHYPGRAYLNTAGMVLGGETGEEKDDYNAIAQPTGAGNQGEVTITHTESTIRTENGVIVENSTTTETETLNVVDSDEAYTSMNIANMNATGVFVNASTDGNGNGASAADAKQLAFTMGQLDGLCKVGEVAACNAMQTTRNDIRRIYGDASEAEAQINQQIADGDITMSPEVVSILNDAYGTTLNITGVNQTLVDEFDETKESQSKAFVLPTDTSLEDLGFHNDETVQDEIITPVEYPDWGGVPARLLNDGYVPLMSDPAVEVVNAETSLDTDNKKIVIPEGVYPPSVLAQGRTLYLPEVEAGTYTAKELKARETIQNEINDIMRGSETLDDLTEIQYTRIKQLEKGIITLDEAVNTGFRGDLNTSVKTREYEQRLMDLKVDESRLQQDLEGTYFNWWGRDRDTERLIEVQSEMSAIQHGMESSKVSTVASIDKGDGAKPTIITEAANTIPLNDDGSVDVEEISVIVQHDPSDNDAQTTWNGHVSGQNDAVIDTHNVILPSQLADSNLPVSSNQIEQYQQAHKIYEGMMTHTDNVPFITVTEEDGYQYQIRDFDNIPDITYVDANGTTQTITNPSAYFGFNSSDGADSYPVSLGDYDKLKTDIAMLFPDVEVGVPPQTENEKAKAKTSAGTVIEIQPDRFYIKR